MRKTTTVTVGMMFLNAAAIMFDTVGLTDAMGVEVSLGATQKLAEARAAANSLDAESGAGETLFALFTSVAKTLDGVVHAAWAGPEMLINLGVPSFVVAFIFAPLTVLVAADIAYLITGREL